ncbi:hypothetical protein [Actinomadura sp. 3N407]|uniref:hypothetical protein n=1 Tax=Actinomadura sp. 3N407 TaxID=3457423 RepID=UPI003FCD9D5E
MELVQGVVALLALAGILFGIPLVLVSLNGLPVPQTTPDLDSVVTALRRRDDGTLFVGSVRVITWLAWAYVALSVLMEFGAQLRGRRAPRLPGLGSLQHVAAKLVAAVLIAFGIGTPAAIAATPAHASPAVTLSAPATPISASPASEPTSTTHNPAHRTTETRTIKHGDTLWGVAEHELGRGERYPEIFTASRAMNQPSGLPRITDPDEIHPGQRVVIPQPGDGSTPQPSPPTAPNSPSPTPTAEPPSSKSPNLTPPTRQTPPAEAPGTNRPSHTDTPTPPPQAPPLKQPSTPSETQSPSAPASQAPPSAGEHEDQGIPFVAIAGVSALAAAGILAALGVKRVLQQRRRRPGRRINLPEPPLSDLEQQLRASESPTDAAFLDRALRSLAVNLATEGRSVPELTAARLTTTGLEVQLATPSPPVPPFTAQDTLLRWSCPSSSTELLAGDPAHETVAPYPALVTAGFDTDGNHVLLDLESIGALCLRGADNITTAVLCALAVELATSSWADDIAVHLVGFAEQLPEALGGDRLRHVPHIDDILPDLEALSTAVGQVLDDSGMDSLRAARTLAVAGDTWTPQIVLIGHPLTPDHAVRIEQLAHQRSSVVAVVAAADDRDEHACLPGTADAWNLRLQDDEEVDLPEAEATVKLQRLMPDDYQRLLGVLHTAGTDDVPPAPDATSPDPPTEEPQKETPASVSLAADQLVWRPTAAGEPSVEEADAAEPSSVAKTAAAAAPSSSQKPGEQPAPPEAEPSDDVTPKMIEEAAAFVAQGGARTLPMLQHKFHLTAAAALQLMDRLDPRDGAAPQPAGGFPAQNGNGPPEAPENGRAQDTSGAGLTTTPAPLPSTDDTTSPPPADAVQSPQPHRAPRVKVLGPVTIVGADGDGGTRRASLTEIAAYLVLHPGCDHHMLTEAIWPGRRTDAATRNSQISRLRRWLGTDPDGNPYLPLVAESGRYALADSITSDWSQFRSLAIQGLNAGAAGRDKLWRALDLVQGQPFAGVNPRRYVWAEYLRQEMISTVVDVAHSLAESCLAAHDSQGAKNAAAKGLLAAPESELLWCDLILAEHQAGDMKGVEAAIDRLTTRNDELGVDLEARTIEVLQHVLHASRNASAAG